MVAALNGIAVGGAAELTLACDARVGHPGSDYLFPENNVGLTISNASTYLLPRLLGQSRPAARSRRTRISGERARELGLIDCLRGVRGRACSRRRSHSSSAGATADWRPRFHLRLLRPPIDEVEAAMPRENAIGAEAWESGMAAEGIAALRRGAASPAGPGDDRWRRTPRTRTSSALVVAPGGPVRRPSLHDRRRRRDPDVRPARPIVCVRGGRATWRRRRRPRAARRAHDEELAALPGCLAGDPGGRGGGGAGQQPAR